MFRLQMGQQNRTQSKASLQTVLSPQCRQHISCLLQVASIAHFQSAPLSFLASEFIQAAAQPADADSPSLQLTAGTQRKARKRRAEEEEKSHAEGQGWQSRLETACLQLPPELTAVAQGLLGCSKKVGLHLGQTIMCPLMTLSSRLAA